MSIYAVYARDGSDVGASLFVKEGFSVGAFLFNVMWFVYHKMWIESVLVLLLLLFVRYTGAFLNVQPFHTVLCAAASVLCGVIGNDLRQFLLLRRGYRHRASIVASSTNEAKFRLYAHLMDDRWGFSESGDSA